MKQMRCQFFSIVVVSLVAQVNEDSSMAAGELSSRVGETQASSFATFRACSQAILFEFLRSLVQRSYNRLILELDRCIAEPKEPRQSTVYFYLSFATECFQVYSSNPTVWRVRHSQPKGTTRKVLPERCHERDRTHVETVSTQILFFFEAQVFPFRTLQSAVPTLRHDSFSNRT